MKIISLKICPYVQQVRVLLEAKKINYEVEEIDPANRPPVVDGGFTRQRRGAGAHHRGGRNPLSIGRHY